MAAEILKPGCPLGGNDCQRIGQFRQVEGLLAIHQAFLDQAVHRLLAFELLSAHREGGVDVFNFQGKAVDFVETDLSQHQHFRSGCDVASCDTADFGVKKCIGAPPDDGTHFGDYRPRLALHEFKVAVPAGFHRYLGDFGLYPHAVGKEVPKALPEVPLQGVKVNKFHALSGFEIPCVLDDTGSQIMDADDQTATLNPSLDDCRVAVFRSIRTKERTASHYLGP